QCRLTTQHRLSPRLLDFPTFLARPFESAKKAERNEVEIMLGEAMSMPSSTESAEEAERANDGESANEHERQERRRMQPRSNTARRVESTKLSERFIVAENT